MKFFKNKIMYGLVLLLVLGGTWVAYAEDPIPHSVIHQVPFTTQAPTGNWANNKDCEETSIIMARAFLEGSHSEEVPSGQTVRELEDIKSWEQEFLGYNRDTGAEATARIAREAAGLQVRILEDYSIQDLKQAVIAGQMVLLPMDASRLGNPRYPEETPFYHMVVITGYEGDNFFVNDPGTETGRDNIYNFGVLKYAAADWNHEVQNMDFEKKLAVVLSK